MTENTTPTITAADAAKLADSVIEYLLGGILILDSAEYRTVAAESDRRAQAKHDAELRSQLAQQLKDGIERVKAEKIAKYGYVLHVDDEGNQVMETATWKATLRQRTGGLTKEYTQKSRIYTWGITEAFAALGAAEKALPLPLDKGEDAANDKAYRDFNRAYAKASREVATEVAEALYAVGAVSNLAHEAVFKFSRTAGCSCPCSPGTVVNQVLRSNGRPADIYVDMKAAA